MTRTEAISRVDEILKRLISRGGFSAESSTDIDGGKLVAEPHLELETHWRPVWKPYDLELLPLDLERMRVDVAAEQIARYRFASYLDIRRKLERLFAELAGERERPIESSLLPDSFLVSGVGLVIEERNRVRKKPEYRILLEDTPLPEQIEAGEPAPESHVLDVTDMTHSEIIELIRKSSSL